jgi:integrase
VPGRALAGLPAASPASRRCARTLGDDALPAIRLHDLRHTHATVQ